MQTSPNKAEQEPYTIKNEKPTMNSPTLESTSKRISKVKLEQLVPSRIQLSKEMKKNSKDEDWVVPVQEDKSTSSRLDHYCLKFDDLNYDQENLLHVVYYIFKGHFDLIVTVDSMQQGPHSKVEKVKFIFGYVY
jgi:hypothetical protein